MHKDDVYTNFTPGLKSLGDNRVGGYLVLFGDEKKTDLVGDYFTSTTDFYGLKSGDKVVTLWHHNLDESVKGTVGEGTVELHDVGWWYESQLAARKGYEKRVSDIMKLVDEGKVGLSSGSPGHLVSRSKKSDGVYHLDSWQIAEASLTCTPCEPRTSVLPLKALMSEVQGKTLTEQTEQTITDLKAFVERIKGYAEMKTEDGRRVSKERRDSFKEVKSLIEEVIRNSDPGPDPRIEAMKIQLMKQKYFGREG